MKQKGISLPINMIVIVAVAVLVLTVVAAFFTGAIGGGIGTIVTEQAFSKGCNLVRTLGTCSDTSVNIAGYKTTTNGIVEDPTAISGVTLLDVCRLKGAGDPTSCLRLCGCPT